MNDCQDTSVIRLGAGLTRLLSSRDQGMWRIGDLTEQQTDALTSSELVDDTFPPDCSLSKEFVRGESSNSTELILQLSSNHSHCQVSDQGATSEGTHLLTSSHPTLLPRTFSSRDNPYSPRFGSGTASQTLAAQSQNFETTNNTNTAIETYSSTDHLSSMGYSSSESNNHPSTWTEANCSSEKMEGDTLPTAHTYSHTDQKQEDDDTTIHSADETVTVDSPALTPIHGNNNEQIVQHLPTMGTPSTISTVPTTDEGSYGGIDPTVLKEHRRAASWEASPFFTHTGDAEHHQTFSSPSLPPPYMTQPNAWTQRVASFRTEHDERYGYPPVGPTAESRWQHPPRITASEGHPLPFLPGRGDARMYQQSQYGYPNVPRRTPAPAATPPRMVRPRMPATTPQQQQQQQQRPPAMSSPSTTPAGPRSAPEILKTLLRKKACLYEPDTSRAVALVTWLVGRQLALTYGFFSRQQLQAGVHACVAAKIDSGFITRTKVNRCMQIILNSCFHYIIPRPDGTEENGDYYRDIFFQEMSDDAMLLELLPKPWNDIVIDRNEILTASVEELEKKGIKKPPNVGTATPVSSPRLGSVPSPTSPDRDVQDDDGSEKRAVLLCFNENVRSAEDVFRCHNEFIRDTAHASNLQLSALEWRSFFGKEAAQSPYVWGNVGIPVARKDAHSPSDALGALVGPEVAKLRTSWCSKRYEHNHELCGFAHAEVNGGWLRRNPLIFHYRDEMCSAVVAIKDGLPGQKVLTINECSKGVNCDYSHSVEEILYHPRRYKIQQCRNLYRQTGCPLGDVCPDFHPVEFYHFPSKKTEGRSGSRGPSRQLQQGATSKATNVVPEGTPILYASPSPISSFERHLFMPGLQNLFRRQCSVVRAHLRSRGSCKCCYSYFGDDIGVNVDTASPNTGRRGLPSSFRI